MSGSATTEQSEAETSRLPFAALVGLVIGPGIGGTLVAASGWPLVFLREGGAAHQ